MHRIKNICIFLNIHKMFQYADASVYTITIDNRRLFLGENRGCAKETRPWRLI